MLIFLLILSATQTPMTPPTTTTTTTQVPPEPTLVPQEDIDCEGSGCGGSGGSGDIDTDDEDLHVSRRPPSEPVDRMRPYKPDENSDDLNTRDNVIVQEVTTPEVPSFTPDMGNGHNNKDLYFPTAGSDSGAYPDPDDPSINEIDVGSRNAKRQPIGASSGIRSKSPVIALAALICMFAARL